MGGLYRDVRLIAADALHIDLIDCGASGVYVTPGNISDSSADIGILVKIANRTNEDRDVTVTAEILNAFNETVSLSDTQIRISENNVNSAKLDLKLEDLILWNGREEPYMYSAKITLLSKVKITDEYIQPFGIREYRIDSEKGFFLNGKYLDLRGVNYHQDSYENG